MTPAQQVKAASTNLILGPQVFFGALVLRLDLIEDPGCGTAWTDGTRLGYDPAFIATLTMDQTVGLIAHEVLHCASGHPWRRGAREPKKANYAMDYAINYIIAEAGLQLPDGALRDKQYDGKSFEWIYDRLPPIPPDKPGQGSGKPGAGGQDVRAPQAGTVTDGTTEADWQQAVQQAALAAKQRGTLPASLARYAKDNAQPKVDWRSVLHRFVQQSAKDDYSWRQPNVRYLAGGLYLPALRSETVGPLAIAIDTSGSIDGVLLDQFAAELRAVVDDVRPSRVHVIYADAKVQHVEVFEPDDVIELHPKGGGGTAFEPVMNYVDAMEDQPVALIYLTDLEGSFRAEPPAMPVLWATITNHPVPYGEVVEVR